MNEIKIWGATLALLLVGAYLSYTKKEEAGTTEAVTIVDQKKDALQEIVLYAKTQTVAVSLREADGQKYGWFEVEVRKRKRSFAGNEETDKLIEGFAPFKALRSLGKDLAGKEFEETKLQKPERRLVLNYGGSQKEFEIGGRTSGARDHYLKAKGGNEVYLVASKILGDLEYPEGKYMQRKLRTAKLDQVEKVSLVAGGKTKVALQRNKAGGKDAFWANEATPDEKNETLGNYLDKLDKLTATDYLDDAKAIEGAATLLEATWFGEEDKNLGTVKLLKKGEGKDAEYFASSTATHLPVKISRFTTEQLEKDLGTIMAP